MFKPKSRIRPALATPYLLIEYMDPLWGKHFPKYGRKDTGLIRARSLVGDDCDIKCCINLDSVCSCPAEVIHSLYWLTAQTIDMVSMGDGEGLLDEFIAALTQGK